MPVERQLRRRYVLPGPRERELQWERLLGAVTMTTHPYRAITVSADRPPRTSLLRRIWAYVQLRPRWPNCPHCHQRLRSFAEYRARRHLPNSESSSREMRLLVAAVWAIVTLAAALVAMRASEVQHGWFQGW